MISFVYIGIMDFPGDHFNNKALVSKIFFDLALNLIFRDVLLLHHSHINGHIFGYAHDFCNQKVKESRAAIPVIPVQVRFLFCIERAGAVCLEN